MRINSFYFSSLKILNGACSKAQLGTLCKVGKGRCEFELIFLLGLVFSIWKTRGNIKRRKERVPKISPHTQLNTILRIGTDIEHY